MIKGFFHNRNSVRREKGGLSHKKKTPTHLPPPKDSALHSVSRDRRGESGQVQEYL